MESTVSGCCLQTKNGDVTATAVPNAFALLLVLLGNGLMVGVHLQHGNKSQRMP